MDKDGPSGCNEQEGLETSVAAPPDGIQAIDKASVHRICSGQVVLTLATAVKELVENAVDAGAKSVEIRLKEHGSELIEVSDNGSGVEEHNFRGLTLKHHTSKLKDFSDLTYVETFGFRGEALSSLCALSKMTVVTCHESVNVGTKLEFDHNGQITSQMSCARQKGTTVMLENLFSTLPVRHKEFLRNIKREFGKMVQVISAYCVISTGVKILCTNQVGKGKKSTIVSVHGNDSMKENITNIFGAKQLQNLIEFKQCVPSEEICTELNIKRPNEDNQIFKVSGFVSSSEHGKGRGSTDRQFYFINKRPCDFQKISRTVNEVYHQYNKHQNPFVCLDITLDKESVDVNVTPDKRQIFIAEEKLLIAIIKTSLHQMFEPLSSVYQVNQATSMSGSLSAIFAKQSNTPINTKSEMKSSPLKKAFSCPPMARPNSSVSGALASLKRSFTSAFAKDSDNDNTSKTEVNKQRKLDLFLNKDTKEHGEETIEPVVSDFSEKHTELKAEMLEDLESADGKLKTDNEKTRLKTVSSVDSGFSSQGNDSKNEDKKYIISDIQSRESCVVLKESKVEGEADLTDELIGADETCLLQVEHERSNFVGLCGDRSQTMHDTDTENGAFDECQGKKRQNSAPSIVTEYDVEFNRKRKCVQVPFSLSSIKERLKQRTSNCAQTKERTNAFHAKINPSDNKEAENELKKEIKKESFTKMEILGQFNKGFIVARLGQDLFIVDQHATDEKYNFEQLQAHTIIKSQKLIQAQRLELTAVNENVLMENIEIFQKNGFDFEIDESADPTQRVRLVSMPVSKTWVFGKDDIEELIFMLSDQPGVLCRPSRVRMMFASRACRKSIMVGTALNTRQMKELLNHMSEIEQPWNCPHGRPTMRHLVNLDALPDS